MPKAIFIPVIGLMLLVSCTAPKTPLLNSRNLPSAFFSINADQPYQLKTTKGAFIQIAANSFDVPAGTRLQLEIKEAYSMQDILLAGLSTMSDGKALQSGGMIYFNATADGKPVKFLKEVGITIPSATYNPAMQLFKGEYMRDSTINWIAPQPLDTSPVAKRLLDGGALFNANCANCHMVDKDYPGPALAGARFRAPFYSWPAYFVNNLNSMYGYDPYSMGLLRKYGSRMTQFNLPEEDINAILDFVDNEAELKQPGILAKMAEARNYIGDTADYVQRIVDSALAFRGTTTGDCGYDTVKVYNGSIQIVQENARIMQKDTLEYVNGRFKAVPSYAFEIESSGWYNIDCFIQQNEASVQSVQLTVTLDQQIDVPLSVYLCIPSKKLLTTGLRNKDGKIVFNGANGNIPLIVGADAFVFATGGVGEDYYYGITPFTIATEQSLTIHLKKDSQEAIINAFKKNKLETVIFDPTRPVLQDIIIPPATPQPGEPMESDSSLKVIGLEVIRRPCDQPTPAIDTARSIYQ